MHSEQDKHLLAFGRQVLEGHVERGLDRPVARGKLVKSLVSLGEQIGQVADRPGGMATQLPRNQGNRQWQESA
jgi:hypothetical protein